MKKNFTIKPADHGQRLDKFLSAQLPDQTRSQIKKMILSGLVLVNNKTTTVHKFLKTDEKVKLISDQKIKKNNDPLIEIKNQESENLEIFDQIKIVATTDDFLIIEKPVGLLVHPTNKHETNTLVDWLITNYPTIKNVGEDPLRPGIVHRLDKDVSGLMIIPLNQSAFEFFKQQFKLRDIDKRYTALVYGEVSKETDEINFAIGRSKAKEGIFAARPPKPKEIDNLDKQAITEFDVIQRFKNYTLLEIKILTGRTHQIRVHLKAYGHPIVGDKLYLNKKIKIKRDLSRIFLHAHYLAFPGPDHQIYKFSSPLPVKLKSFLKSLKNQPSIESYKL